MNDGGAHHGVAVLRWLMAFENDQRRSMIHWTPALQKLIEIENDKHHGVINGDAVKTKKGGKIGNKNAVKNEVGRDVKSVPLRSPEPRVHTPEVKRKRGKIEKALGLGVKDPDHIKYVEDRVHIDGVQRPHPARFITLE